MARSPPTHAEQHEQTWANVLRRARLRRHGRRAHRPRQRVRDEPRAGAAVPHRPRRRARRIEARVDARDRRRPRRSGARGRDRGHRRRTGVSDCPGASPSSAAARWARARARAGRGRLRGGAARADAARPGDPRRPDHHRPGRRAGRRRSRLGGDHRGGRAEARACWRGRWAVSRRDRDDADVGAVRWTTWRAAHGSPAGTGRTRPT